MLIGLLKFCSPYSFSVHSSFQYVREVAESLVAGVNSCVSPSVLLDFVPHIVCISVTGA